MKSPFELLKYLAIGVGFGVVLIKSEVASWYRIHEMFHFQSFHMFGIIGSAIVVGAISIFLLKRLHAKAVTGERIDPKPKEFQKVGNLAGGFLFGLGWALTGACPGPMYALFGAGYTPILLALAGALAGAWLYAVVRPRLPH
ncbi:MAG: DUF6691 family protein [Verrucomicrobiales bacterium]